MSAVGKCAKLKAALVAKRGQRGRIQFANFWYNRNVMTGRGGVRKRGSINGNAALMWQMEQSSGRELKMLQNQVPSVAKVC